MKKYALMIAVLSLATTQVLAQASAVDSEVDQELDQMYSTRQTPQAGGPTGATIAPQGAQSGQPIYILNQATPTAQASSIQKQPTTYIEASPLNKSRAEQIREARQQVEAETESKIVEKLEQSRIEDEKRRANVLFGEKFDRLDQTQQQPMQQQQQQAVVVTPAPAPVVTQAPTPAPTPVVAVIDDEPKEDTRDVVREEIRAAFDAEKSTKPDSISRKYFSSLAGIGDYPKARNVRGNYVLGASFGTNFDDAYSVEGGFVYSNYTVQKLDGTGYYVPDQYGQWQYVPALVDVEQYAASLAVKYYLLSGMVKPIVGGLVQYSHRNFTWSAENYGGTTYTGGGEASSQAIDLGIITGADFEMSEKFTLGVDFRYYFNLSSRITTNNKSYFLTTPAYGTPIEKMEYYNLSVVARVSF